MSLTRIIRELLTKIFPQEQDFTQSQYPIYINYTNDTDTLTTKRIVIYSSNSNRAERFVGDREYLRNLNIEVAVFSPDDEEAYDISMRIYKYLRKINGDYGILRIEPMTDVDFIAFTSKKLYTYACSYAIIKEEI